MHTVQLNHHSTSRKVERVSKAKARRLYMGGVEITCTDGYPSVVPTPRDTAYTAEANFDDYANAADFYANGLVYYWAWVK